MQNPVDQAAGSTDAVKLVRETYNQCQLLACLKWLGDFQVLACIPNTRKIAVDDAAALAGVPASQFRRIIRLSATAGFLQEPEDGYVAHTPLSSQFLARPSLFDAISFIANVAAPSALSMTEATIRAKKHPAANAFTVASPQSISFADTCGKDRKLQRHLAAFERLGSDAPQYGAADVLSTLDWSSLGGATVVEVGSRSKSTAAALLALAPGLHFVLQLYQDQAQYIVSPYNSGEGTDSNTPITIQCRSAGTPQTIIDAAVYILHIPASSLTESSETRTAHIKAELKSHFNVLRVNPMAVLVLVVQKLPEPGSSAGEFEAFARANDLLQLQLGCDQALMVSELASMLASVGDATGSLCIVNRLLSQHGLTTALEVQIRPHGTRSN